MGADPDIPRAEARRIVTAGLAAVAAGPAIARALGAEPPAAPVAGGRRLVLAIGRFAGETGAAAFAALGPCEALIVTDQAGAAPVEGARVLVAGWPEPDAAGLRAAEAVEAALGRLGPGDAVLLLLSAGAERMVPAPAAGLLLADLAETGQLMRAAGAGAGEALLVRQQLSRFEGGGLSRLGSGATVTALVVADGESGEDPRRIAGGMLAPPLGSRVTARALLELYGLWDRVSGRVRERLASPAGARGPARRLRLRIVAGNSLAVAVMAAAGARGMARPLGGGPVEIVHDILAVAAGLSSGAAAAFGIESEALLARPAADAGPEDHPEAEPGAVLTLGPAVVAGAAGPRHADLALRFALLARDRRLAGPWALVLTASDGGGPDGRAPGMAADSGTLTRLGVAGIDPDLALERGEAAAVLDRIGAAFRSGPTGTDVGDIAVLVRG